MATQNILNAGNETTIFASALRAETGSPYTSDDFVLYNPIKGGVFVLDITAESGVHTLDVKIQMKDSLSGQYIDIAGCAFAQKSATGVSMLTVYPGIAETANVSVSDVLPAIIRAHATAAGAGTSMTWSLTFHGRS